MIIEIMLSILGLYLGIGFLFAIVFTLFGGAKAIDPAAVGATLGFRLLIIPGGSIFWPLLLKRWIRKQAPPEEGSYHRQAAKDQSQ